MTVTQLTGELALQLQAGLVKTRPEVDNPAPVGSLMLVGLTL